MEVIKTTCFSYSTSDKNLDLAKQVYFHELTLSLVKQNIEHNSFTYLVR